MLPVVSAFLTRRSAPAGSRPRPPRFAGVLGAIGAAVCGSGAPAQPAFHGVGFLLQSPPASFAYGVSPDGTVVVGWSQIPAPPPLLGYGSESFYWTAQGGIVGMVRPPGFVFSTARGASAGGAYIAGFHQVDVSAGHRAYRWSTGAGYEYLGDLPGGINASVAYDISPDGRFIAGAGNYTNAPITAYGEAILWTEGVGVQGLGGLPGAVIDSQAQAVSADGTVVAGSARPPGAPLYQYVPFRWTATGGMQAIGLLPGGLTGLASDMSADGRVIVGVSGSTAGAQAFRWVDGEGMTGLGDLPGGGSYSSAYAVSADGNTIVGIVDTGAPPNGDEPFVWTPWRGMRSLTDLLVNRYGLSLQLPLGTLTLQTPFGISADGRTITGYGVFIPINTIEGWVAEIACYADCDDNGSGTVGDFGCFQTKFVAGDPYADCNLDGQRTVADFGCFQTRFIAECP